MAADDAGLRYATVPELRRRLDDRAVSPVELADSAVRLLDELGRPLNAVATPLPGRAREEAEAAAKRLARHRPASVLDGIPYGIKDLFTARGGPTTWGVPKFADRIIDEDAEVVRRLARKGAVLAAKLAMVEMAGGGRPRLPGASLQGQPANPWNHERYAGGSSSGSGIAVSLGLVPYAIGTETGGSVLGPAAFSGVTGIRPTFGLVPRTGGMLLSWSLDKVGVLARTAEDCGLVLAAIAGPDQVDPDAVGRYRPRGLDAGQLRSMRVGWDPRELEELHPDIRSAIEDAFEAFRGLGVTMVEAAVPNDQGYGDDLELVMRAEAAEIHRELLEDPEFRLVDDKQLAELRQGLQVGTGEYLRASRRGREAELTFGAIFAKVDVLLAASRPTTAPRLAPPREPRTDATRSDVLRNVGNLIGLPGISFPSGLATDGLPTGLQLVGPRGSDAILVVLAEAFQRATTFHHLRPPDPTRRVGTATARATTAEGRPSEPVAIG